MQGALILAKENSELRVTNAKQKQKRNRSNRKIPHECDISVQEVRELRSEPIETQIARIVEVRE